VSFDFDHECNGKTPLLRDIANVRQQRGLADSGFPADEHGPPAPGADIVQGRQQHIEFVRSSNKHANPLPSDDVATCALGTHYQTWARMMPGRR
jgi:hypothetical protein